MATVVDLPAGAGAPAPQGGGRRRAASYSVLFAGQFVAAMAPWATPPEPAVEVAIAWFATGVGIAGVWMLGAPAALVVVAATLLQRFAYGYQPLLALGEAIGSGLEAWVGAAVMRRLRVRPDFDRLRDVFGLFAAAAVAPFVSMAVAYLVRAVPASFLQQLHFLDGWTAWWRMNALGAVTIVPMALACQQRLQRPWCWSSAVEGLATVGVALCLLTLVVFVCEPSATCITIAYAVLVVALVAALRQGPIGANAIALVGVVFITVATTMGHGPFQSVPLPERHAAAQVFALTLVAVPLVLGALIAERSAHALRWSRSEHARRALLAVMPDATLRIGSDGRVRDVHVPAGQELLLPRQLRPGARIAEVGDPLLAARLTAACVDAAAGRRPEPIDVLLPREGGERAAEVRCVPAADGDVLVVVRDVTARRELEAQLRHAQKLEAVGLLAGGVAHDFNNLLTVIGGNAEEFLRELPAEDPRRQLVAEIADAARRGADLTRQLLAFSRQQVLAPESLELGAIVGQLAPLLRRLLGSNILLATEASAPVWVRADRSRIEQVVMNLAVNARDAMPRGGRLRIVVRGVAAPAGVLPGGGGADCAELAVHDEGVGMTAEVCARAFEPFFTTKAPGCGTGLGLATVYGIVQQSGGAVAIDTVPGGGTVVRVWLPGVAPPVVGAVVTPPAPRVAVRPARLLLVEDEPPVRSLLARGLVQGGHAVVVAENGEQALAIAAVQGPFDLVVSDVVMPRLGGVELVARLREERPTLPVLFVTAHPLGAEASVVVDPHTEVLAKPVAVAELMARIDTMLAAAASAAVPRS